MLQKSWGPGGGEGCDALFFMQPCIYILHFVCQPSSRFLSYGHPTHRFGVGENTTNMVKVAMEQPALAHFTKVDIK
jgi:hypothetical protein